MNGDFADGEGVVRYAASTLCCRVGPVRGPLVSIPACCIQLTCGEKFQVAMLRKDL